VHAGEGAGFEAVQHGLLGGRQAVGTHQGELGVGQAPVGLARPGVDAGRGRQQPGPQLPVVGLLRARDAEGEQAVGVVEGVAVEGHEPAGVGEVGHGRQQLRLQRQRARSAAQQAH
jgi:hypothetical protein